MRNRLIGKEKQFLTDVLKELKQYDISLEERDNIKRQILEHIQECREHGEDSIDDLGTPQLFVQDFLEINEVDLQVKMKQLQNKKGKFNTIILSGIFIAVITYLISQTIFSILLTESFNPTISKDVFQYNLLYRISENQWWNALLILTSLTLSVVVYISLVSYKKRKHLKYNEEYDL
ncbi:hypothetical protein COK00_16120 [Bacillus cereus]|uniref:DUF1129 domain-containing protein n=1 Tax=Bacillus cereus TaxID=1396 RepID=A0A2C1XZE1_BACCE|nr:hypothetical protein [Bacillus cereus]PEC83744.1 hypothetical protein CON28_19575 [Bacillus cereus]PEQ46215.1 hypothetical protein CN468_23565 [Bacillus cereus]PEX35560.1 hypothetical protein CN455_23200 [Bacillus cereus]PFB12387.1 hypothetical protein CN399_21855 [Bacillus cereus]PFB61867.1 hypothetical protein CN291_22490 [Bacillus cereus]